jgi:hypothetical protein
MLNSRAAKRMPVPPDPAGPAIDDDPHRRTLVYLLNFLLAGFERTPTARIPATVPHAEWLDRWEDDQYVYLETSIPGEPSGLELDMNVYNGVIYARISHRREDQGLGGTSTAAEAVGPAQEA